MTSVKKDLMVEAAKELLDRKEQMADRWEDVVKIFTWKCEFGGQGGSYSDYPTSYSTGGIKVSGFWPWEDDDTIIASETHSFSSDAPWADQMYDKWTDEVTNRTNEFISVAEELGTMKRIMMKVLDDLTNVDLDNVGLLEKAEE